MLDTIDEQGQSGTVVHNHPCHTVYVLTAFYPLCFVMVFSMMVALSLIFFFSVLHTLRHMSNRALLPTVDNSDHKSGVMMGLTGKLLEAAVTTACGPTVPSILQLTLCHLWLGALTPSFAMRTNLPVYDGIDRSAYDLNTVLYDMLSR